MFSDRPKPEETEDDLLKLQNKFFGSVKGIGSGGPSSESDVQSSVRVDKRKVGTASGQETPLDNISTTGKRVKFKLPDDRHDDDERMETDRIDPLALGEDILMDIVECNVNNVRVSAPTKSEGSFPRVIRCNPKDFATSTETKTRSSIFARHLQKARTVQSDGDRTEPSVSQLTSSIVDGTGLDESKSNVLAREIHDENVEKLSRMTKEEILEEQSRLVTSLNPKLLNFLKTRQRQRSDEKQNGGKLGVEQMSVSDEEKFRSSENASEVDDLPIPPTEVSKYVNMSKVEMEKLTWTTSLPDPKPFDPKTGCPARFDFEGLLLSRDEDVSVRRALHHHGEEPEVAGYTLEELFIYSRSSVLQQRALGLNTLAKILAKNGEGYYDDCLSAPLVPQLLDSGIVLLLRWALDDNTEASLAPCVAALHSLVVNTADEVCLDRTFAWYRGEEMPYLRPTSNELTKDEDEKELSDAELIKIDVVKGLIRMDILPRLRYVLEILRPSAPVIVHILEILIRLSRHSLQVADTVARCPRLIPVIVKEFIPILDSTSDRIRGETERQLSSCYGIPMHRAIKLIRILASTGRHLATYLLGTHKIMDSVLSYMDVNVPLKSFLGNVEYMQLLMEMYRTWKVFLTYGLSGKYFDYYYPMIGRRIHVNETLSMNTDVFRTMFDCNLAAELIALVTVIIESATEESVVSRHIFEMQLMIKKCLTKWLWELAHSDEQITYSLLKLVGVTFTALVAFYEARKLRPSFNVVDSVDEINELLNSSIVPFMTSKVFSNLSSVTSSSSFLLSGSRLGTDRDPSPLPTLGSLVWGGHLTSLCADNSPFVFFGHFLHSLSALRRIHGGLDDRFRSLLFNNEHVVKYLERIGTEIVPSVGLGRHWFARFEVNVLFDLLVLSSPGPLHPRLFHKAAMAVMHWLQNGDEKIASELMSSVVFNSEFISEVNDVEVAIRELSMNDRNSLELSSFVFDQTKSDRSQLLQQTFANLPSICSTYTKFLLESLPVVRSCQSRESLAVRYVPGSIVIDSFEFFPIVTLFSKTTKDGSQTTDAYIGATTRTTVVHCLQWCHLLGCLRGDLFGREKAEALFCHFATVFLIASDLFLDPSVHRYLKDIVQLMSRRNDFSRMHLSLSLESSFNDFYKQLLAQFEAVSYGDHLFGIFVMIPMQMRYALHFRRIVWTEHVNALRVLGVRFDELPVSLEEFLDPIEEDVILLGSYLSALLRGLVRPNWCPVPYVIAVHHVHNFLFGGGGGGGVRCVEATGPASDMLKRLRSFENSVVYEHIVRYGGLNTSSSLGFDVDH